MNSEIPFNPIPIPDGLLLSEAAATAQPMAAEPSPARTKKPPRRKAKRKSKTASAPHCEGASRWRRIKGRFNARLSQMDPETLKRILTAAGVAAGVIIAILIAIKLTPVALVLLVILGLAFVLRLWDRLRFQPYPSNAP